MIDRFLLAHVPGLDPSQPANPDEVLPSVDDRVAEKGVTQRGYVSADKVVYSLYLGTMEGDYTFNWVGLLAADDTLVAVRYIDPINKVKTAGGELGNAMARNFLVTYIDAQAITQITVDAKTWQLQFDWASEEQAGLARIARQEEVNTGEDGQAFVTPKSLTARTATTVRAGIVPLASAAQVETGTNKTHAVTPDLLASFAHKGSGDTFEKGTVLIFPQAMAPTGWVKSTTLNNRALRLVSGNGGGLGGLLDFSTVFTKTQVTSINSSHTPTITVGIRTLTSANIPSGFRSGMGQHSIGNAQYSAGRLDARFDGSAGGNGGRDHPATSSTIPGHAHISNIDVKYVDAIVCVKE